MRGCEGSGLAWPCRSIAKVRGKNAFTSHASSQQQATVGPRANKVGVRDGDGSLLRQPLQPAVFILPAACRFRSRAIPQNALSGAKDLPTTVLCGHGVSVAGQSFEKVSDVKAACSGGGVMFHS
jgi:hypothetical protein